MLYNLLEASSIFEKRRQKSGDIRPKNVLIDEKGEIAVVNMLTFPDETTNYLKSLDFQVAAYLGNCLHMQLLKSFQNCKSVIDTVERILQLQNRFPLD